jgi:hypothetical protein
MGTDKTDAQDLDEATLDAIDLAEDQIDRGECRDWKDVRQQIRDKFLNRAMGRNGAKRHDFRVKFLKVGRSINRSFKVSGGRKITKAAKTRTRHHAG